MISRAFAIALFATLACGCATPPTIARFGLVLRAHASLQRVGAPPAAATDVQTFACSAPPSNLAIWLDESSDFVETVLGNCTRQLAAQVVAEMTRK